MRFSGSFYCSHSRFLLDKGKLTEGLPIAERGDGEIARVLQVGRRHLLFLTLKQQFLHVEQGARSGVNILIVNWMQILIIYYCLRFLVFLGGHTALLIEFFLFHGWLSHEASSDRYSLGKWMLFIVCMLAKGYLGALSLM